MIPELIMKSDVLDILFENRNKTYGAYTLRKFYSQTLFKALGIMLLAVMVLICLTSILTTGNKIILDPVYFVKEHVMKNISAAKDNIPGNNPVKKNNHSAVTAVKKAAFLSTHISITPVQFSKIDDSINAENTLQVNSAVIGSNGVTAMHNSGSDNPGLTESNPPVTSVSKPTDAPDVYPSYPGGMKALKAFLEKHLKDPENTEITETVTVKVRFIVCIDGKLKQFEIEQDGGEVFNNEVLRVLKMMPDWIPGKSNGRNVDVYHVLPVKFVAGNDYP